MLRYISIIDLIVLGGLAFAWVAPRKVLSFKERKEGKMSEDKIMEWLPRVRPIVIGLFVFLVIGRIAMYYFFPRFADMNSAFWGLRR